MRLKDDVVLTDQAPVIGEAGRPAVPELAIPLQTKQDFAFPKTHHAALEELLETVDRILIIGWRATDTPFLKLLKKGLKLKPYGMIVTGTDPDAAATRITAAGIKHDLEPIRGGFTEFVLDRRVRELGS
jgi:hypothetical protein